MRRALIVGALLLASCGDSATETTQGPAAPSTTTAPATTSEPATTAEATSRAAAAVDGCAHVIDATISDDGGSFTIAATVRSDDQGWDKYADAWQVWDADGVVLAERVLTHPHENEQPFTRSQSGIAIPEELDTVTVAARDLVLGFCGDTFELQVPGR